MRLYRVITFTFSNLLTARQRNSICSTDRH